MKNTFTATYDLGWVVVVVAGCGSNRLNGTLDGAMDTGALWVGMAQPAATRPSRPTNNDVRSRLVMAPLGLVAVEHGQRQDEAGAAGR